MGKEIDYAYEELLCRKNKILLDENNKLYKVLREKNSRIKNLISYVEKKLISINQTIKFSEYNGVEDLQKNIGKKEIIEKILAKVNKIYREE